MTSRRDVSDALHDAGAARIEPVEPRLDALEARVMVAISDDEQSNTTLLVPAGVTDLNEVRLQRRTRLALVTAAAAIVVAVVLTFSLPGARNDELVIVAADGVTIVLPDGSRLAGDPGTELPDGARLDVSGMLRVGERDYGPGIYDITDGAIVRAGTAPGAAQTTTTTSSNRAVPRSSVSVPPPADGAHSTAPSTTRERRASTTLARVRPTGVDTPVRTRPTTTLETRPSPAPRTTPPVTRPTTTPAPTTAPTPTRPQPTEPPVTRPVTSPPRTTEAPPTRPSTTSRPGRAP